MRKIVLVFLLSLLLSACRDQGDSGTPPSQSSPAITPGKTPENPYFENQNEDEGEEPAPSTTPPAAEDPDDEEEPPCNECGEEPQLPDEPETPAEEPEMPAEPPAEPPIDAAQKKVDLGRYLFHDRILSGNKNISCATCHPVWSGTTDGLSLPIGEGGFGVGTHRVAGSAFERVPRNVQALYNLGYLGVKKLFHDGRVSTTDGHTFTTPAGDQLPDGLENVLAAQALFPLVTPVEMAGNWTENEIAAAVSSNSLTLAWETISRRLRQIPEYVALFKAAFNDITDAGDIQIRHVVNAIAAYETSEFRADNSPYDRYLQGDNYALSPAAIRGKNYFYGGAKCFRCHSGDYQSDFEFHSIGMPQIGPGTGRGLQGLEDYGRGGVTGNPYERYQFRTPSLRNVAITGPWGHAGAYTSLRSMVEHYRNPEFAMADYNEYVERPLLPYIGQAGVLDFAALSQTYIVRSVGDSNQFRGSNIRLTDDVVDDLLAFLDSLTDPTSLNLAPPESVPSGLPVK